MSPLVVGDMSLYELISTASALQKMDDKQNIKAPEVSEDEWRKSMDVMSNLAQFDPSIRLE